MVKKSKGHIQQQLESTEDCEEETYSTSENVTRQSSESTENPVVREKEISQNTPENVTQQSSASTENPVVYERVKNADGDSRHNHIISERAKKKDKKMTREKEYACLSMLGAGIAIGGALFDSKKATAIGTAVAITSAIACWLEEDD